MSHIIRRPWGIWWWQWLWLVNSELPRRQLQNLLVLIISFVTTRRLTAVALLSVLVVYGLMVDPTTGSGGLPCLWTLIFQHECGGCGLSRAGAHLMRGHFTEALTMNWLIIPVVGLIAWQLAKPFLSASNNNNLS